MNYKSRENLQSIKNLDTIVDAACLLLQQARRRVLIRSALLDPSLFESLAFNAALSAFARQSRYSEVQILIDLPGVVRERGGKTLDLARRLSDKIAIKVYFDKADEQRDSVIVTDNQGVLIKSVDEEPQAFYSLTDKVHNKALSELFANDWQLSRIASELRQLAI